MSNAVIWPSTATLTNLLTLANITATKTGAGIDIQAFKGKALAFLDAAAPSAGTNPTLACKLQSSPEANKVTSITGPTGTGNGKCIAEAGPDPVAETFTLTATSATQFSVVGGTSGNIGTATVGTWFTSAQINVLISAGSVAFVVSDSFSIPTTARTWTDLVSFTGQTAALLREKKVVDLDQCPRYLRAVATLGGTASPAYIASMNLLTVND